MSDIPYTCTNLENQGRVILYQDGAYLNLITSSRCFAEYICAVNGWTWAWESGVDPDDPTTWPDYAPPDEPAGDPELTATN
jgi:hypothetical protein